MLDKVIRPIASQRRLLMTSLKMTRAITDVATISKLFNRDAFADVVFASPIINRIGAAISRMIIPMIYGKSLLVKCCLNGRFISLLRTRPSRNIPIPAPRYSRAAIIVGGTSCKSSFDAGTLAAYKTAAKMAQNIEGLIFFLIT